MFTLFIILIFSLVSTGYPLKILGNDIYNSTIRVNRGIRDVVDGGSAWFDGDGRLIGNIRLASDFLLIENNPVNLKIYSYDDKRIYTLNFGEWNVDDGKINILLRDCETKVYFFDWLSRSWRIWQRDVDNITYGMPDFNHPAFKQVFKWMMSFMVGSGYLNIIFYMTSHDPYIRVFVNSSVEGYLYMHITPSKLLRMGLEANLSDYNRNLLNWNQRDSKKHGNPWASAAWGDCPQGFVGQTYLLSPHSVVRFREKKNYHKNLNRFIQGHAYDFYNWIHNRTGDWYSYEFYVRNEGDMPQDIILENYVPDSVDKIKVSYYNGREYVEVGSWDYSNFSDTLYFTDSLGYTHYITVNEPVDRGEYTRSGLRASEYYGVIRRVLIQLNLSGGLVNDPDIYGRSQLRLRLKIHYNNPGYATYLFSNDSNSKYGLLNMLYPYMLFYNYSGEDYPLFISTDFTKAFFYMTADEDEVIRDIGFKIDLSSGRERIFSLGYNGLVNTLRDDDEDEVPDIFQYSSFEWSRENIANLSRTSTTYYDIISWNTTSMGRDLTKNSVRLKWHGDGEKLFGIGIPYGYERLKYVPYSVRNLRGYLHIIEALNNDIIFTTSYDVEKSYTEKFKFDYENSTLNIIIGYRTRSGYPYKAYTVTEVKDLIRRIYRCDEIPEGRRNMPGLNYWKINMFRNDSDDTLNWHIDINKDDFIRQDIFSFIRYLIKVTVDPEVSVDIDYNKVVGVDNLNLAFDFGDRWSIIFSSETGVEKADNVGFKMARIHLRALYKGVRYPPSPSLGWDPVNHRSIGYDWSGLDYWILDVVNKWRLTPLMSIGGPKIITIPKNMPYINLGGGKILPDAIDFAQYFADVTKHIAVDLNISPVYLEVMNEPYLKNDTVAIMYMKLYNTVREKVAEVLKPYNKRLGRDVFLGINYIDRGSNLKKPFFEYVFEYADDLEFGSVHDYPGGWGTCFSPRAGNPSFVFYPPNNRYGWFTDEVAINRTYQYTYVHGEDPRITFKEMRSRWRKKFGHDLMLLNTEANFASGYKNGSDPRQQNLISAVVHAIMLKNFALNNFSYYTFFTLASMHTPKSPMYRFGDRGFAIMNWTSPHNPYAPYLVAYLWGNYIKSGSKIYHYNISNLNLIDILPVKVGDTYRIWIVNKVDSAISVDIMFSGIYPYNVQMHVLDSGSYVQRYDPNLGRVVFGSRDIRSIRLHPSHQIKIKLRGYSVAVLEFKGIRLPFLWRLLNWFWRLRQCYPISISYDSAVLYH